MADRTTARRCSHAVLGQHHDAHDWEPQPGMDPVHCPGREQLPVDRLRNLVDRACRHLTPDEGAALRDALAGTMHNATTAIEARHQELAEQAAELERARRVAVALENENRRLEDRVRELRTGVDDLVQQRAKKADKMLGYMERAERAEQQLAQARRVARNYPGLRHLHAALDGTQQPECTGCGDTGACNGGPCAHPDAQQPSPDGVPQHAARGTNAEDCPACCANAASGSAPSYPWLCPGPPATPATDRNTTGRTSP